jgi:hypothetical protein
VKSAYCAVESAYCAVESAYCAVESAYCAVESTYCGVESAYYAMVSAYCALESAYYAVGTVSLNTTDHVSSLRNFTVGVRVRSQIRQREILWWTNSHQDRVFCFFRVLRFSSVSTSLLMFHTQLHRHDSATKKVKRTKLGNPPKSNTFRKLRCIG